MNAVSVTTFPQAGQKEGRTAKSGALMFVISLLISLSAFANPKSEAPKNFGAALTVKKETSLATAVQDASKIQDQDILVTGEIKRVCLKKGCWLELQNDRANVRVMFKDYAFFAPTDSSGRRIRAQGRMNVKTETVEKQRHYLEDVKAPKSEIEAIQEPKSIVTFIASGFEFLP